MGFGGGIGDGGREFGEDGLEVGEGVLRAVAGDENFLVAARVGALFRGQNLLEEFFAGAQAGELDVYVLVGFEAVEADQLFGDVNDMHRLAHVEDEDLPALPQNGCLKHQRHRLGDGHEVALHLRMRHRQRAAVLKLVEKERQHASPAAEHVSEAHRDKLRPFFPSPSDGGGQGGGDK